MKKDWIPQRIKLAQHLLSQLGVHSLDELSNASLLIHVNYGGNQNDGCTVLAKVHRVYFRKSGISFEFKGAWIEIDLDANPKKKLGGDLVGIGPSDILYIETVAFSQTGWVAIYSHNDEWSEMRQNLDVSIVST